MKAEKSGDNSQPMFDVECYDQHRPLVAIIMARFFLRYLNLLYRSLKVIS